jgi:hypothetical protein
MLNKLFDTLKSEGLVTKDLDLYLLTCSDDDDNDRALNVNAPSSIGKCLRARYYSRTLSEKDSGMINPRTRRIYDNGKYVHKRIQEYLLKQGMLLMDEVPVINEQYNIQGHTDGIVARGSELIVLEIKSIKMENFNELKDAQPEHKKQAHSYLFCLEERRKYLRATYKNDVAFLKSGKERSKYYESFYQHLKDGEKYTREEKIAYQVGLNMKKDKILFKCAEPHTKCSILYECKNTQNLKEYLTSSKDATAKMEIKGILEDCTYLDRCVKDGTVPEREGTSKSCKMCHFCDFQNKCWVV